MKSKILKLSIPVAGLAALAMRWALYATGFDGRSLLMPHHWARIGLLVLTGVVAVALPLLGWSVKGSDDLKDARPASLSAAIGSFAAAVAMNITCIREFAEFSAPMGIACWVLGLAATVCFIATGVCRLQDKQPHFALHCLICVYFGLRAVTKYRIYSSDPMVQNYTFYLMAYVALMLTAYRHAAFDANMTDHRALWICSLGAVYLCLAAMVRCADALLLGACALWAFTNLTNLSVRRRRERPRLLLDEEEAAQ